MNNEKLIVIGCDDAAHLSNILISTKELSFAFSTITADRTSDLIRILNAMDAHLVILCFRNNQHLLDDFGTFVKECNFPMICLSNKAESELLTWNPKNSVFTYINEHLKNKFYLSSRINSVFLLNKPIEGDQYRSEQNQEPNVSQNTHELSRYVMQLDQKDGILANVKNRISELYPLVDDTARIELTAIVNTIKRTGNHKQLWSDFKLYFEQNSPLFLYSLAKKYPFLTTIDLKYCCYLKMNMTNDDIRTHLGINQESVRTHKYRLKKKMAIPKGQDLRNFLISVS